MHELLNKYFARFDWGDRSALAKQLGVRPQTISKWINGETSPKSERWPQLEELLHMPKGSIAIAAGFTPLPQDVDIVALAAEVQRQGAVIARIEALLDEQDEPRSSPMPTRSREAAPTTHRGRVDP